MKYSKEDCQSLREILLSFRTFTNQLVIIAVKSGKNSPFLILFTLYFQSDLYELRSRHSGQGSVYFPHPTMAVGGCTQSDG